VSSAPAILMSIRPAYSDAILAGEKTVELRRRRPAFDPGTVVLIYSSSPNQHVCGIFETGKIIEAEPSRMWRRVRHRAGITKRDFDAYFDGCDLAYAIEVHNARRIPPAQLPVRPPQSYQWLRWTERLHLDLLKLAYA
jgi:predicted transcriptional regulator